MTIALSCIFFILLCLIFWLLLICPADSSPEQLEPFIGRAFAHRGLHDLEPNIPENSLAAFRLAVSHGYGIELDIALSRDGEVVVFHDANLKRMCGIDAELDSLDWAELQKLRLRDTEETIPLLSDVLSLVDGQVPLIVEYKSTKDNRLLTDRAFALLSAYEGPFCVESFDPRILWRIRHQNPRLLRGQLACRPSKVQTGIKAFFLQHLLCNGISRPHFIAYEHSQRREISFRAAVKLLHAVPVLWTVKSLEDYYRLYDQGIDIQIFEGFLPPAILMDAEEETSPENEEASDASMDEKPSTSETEKRSPHEE